MSHCNGLNKNLADLFYHRSQLIIISYLKAPHEATDGESGFISESVGDDFIDITFY